MVGKIEIAVKGASAQDLYFVEREVPGAEVIEESPEDSRSRFGMPGVVEAVILVSALSAAVGAILYIAKSRKSGEIIVRQSKSPDGTEQKETVLRFESEDSPEILMNKIDKVITSLSTVAAI